MLLLLCLASSTLVLFGQSPVIKGTIYDELEMGVIGASVRLKSNPSKGTASNLDGVFTINAQPGEILVFSYVGYKTVELPAKNGMVVRL